MSPRCPDNSRTSTSKLSVASAPSLAAGGLPPIIKSYMSADMLCAKAGRPLRILAEYLGPQERFHRQGIRDTVAIFGSARIHDPQGKVRPGAACAAATLAPYYERTRDLARRFSVWAQQEERRRHFVLCTGGGPGIMEAANRGAQDAGGVSIGLGIALPEEVEINPYVTPELAFFFHYFFMRKFWFTYFMRAAIFMPGGLGTLDELAEILTLAQTGRWREQLPWVLFGREYWESILNLEAMARLGTIVFEELGNLLVTDDVEEAMEFLTPALDALGAHED